MSALNTPDWLRRAHAGGRDGAGADAPGGGASPGSWSDARVGPRSSGGADGTLPSGTNAFVVGGAHDEALDGEYWVDAEQPAVNDRPHYCGSGGGHVYYLPEPGRWALNDRFTPHKTLDSSCVATYETDGGLPAGRTKWQYHAVVLGMAKVSGRQRELETRELADALSGGREPPPPPSPTTSAQAGRKPTRSSSPSSADSVCRLPDDTLPGVAEMADIVTFLRADPGESAETMRLLAEELLLAPLPAPWFEFYEGLYGGMFYHNPLTTESSWHHPLERHFTVTTDRLNRLSVAAQKLREAGDVQEAEKMQTRHDNVLTLHAHKLQAILDEETEQAREIRRMRFARVFRQHANKEADRTKSRERLLLEKVTSIMTTPSREEAEDSPAQPAKKTFGKWSKAVKNVQAVAAAEKEEAAKAEANASPRDTTRSEDADGGGPDGTLSITRSRSKPHDFNSTQLAQWRVLTHHKTSSVGEDSVRAEAAELIGPPSASRMTQGRILLALRQEQDWERPPAATRIQALARGWLTRKHNYERMLARMAEMERLVSGNLRRIAMSRMNAVWLGWGELMAQKRRRDLAMQMLLRMRHKALFQCLQAFSQRVAEQSEKRRKEELALQMARRLQNALQIKAWLSWGRYMDLQQRRAAAEQMVRRLQNVLLYKCFMAFAYIVQLDKQKQAKDDKARSFCLKMRNAFVFKCLLQWVAYTDSKRRKHRATLMLLRLRHRELFLCVQAFKDHMRHAQKKEVARRFLLKLQNATVAMAWMAWEDYTVARRRKANALKMALRLANQMQFKCLLSWVHYTDVSRRKKMAMQILSRMQEQVALRCLLEWRELTAATVMMRGHEESATRMMARLVNQRLHEAFSQWGFWAADTASKKELAKSFVVKMMNSLLYQALLQWSFWAADTREKREKALGLIRRMMHRQASLAFCRWAEWVDEMLELKSKATRVLMRMKNRQLAHGFIAWATMVEDKVCKREIATRMVKKLLNRQLDMAFQRWHEWAADVRCKRDQARSMLLRMLNRQLDLAFQQWHFWAVDVSEKRELVSQMLKRMLNKQLYEAFSAWTYWLADKRAKAAIAANALGHLMNRTSSAAFRRWCDWLRELHMNRERVRGHLAVMMNREAHKVIQQWQSWVKDAQRLREVASTVMRRMQNKLLYSAFLQWQESVEDTKREQIALQMLGRLQNRALYLAHNAWLSFVEHARHKAAATKMLLRLKNKVLFESFNAWLTFRDGRRRKKLAMKMLCRLKNKALFAGFISWQDWLEFERRKKLARKMLSRLRAKDMFVAFTSWQDFVSLAQEDRLREEVGRNMLLRLQNKVIYSAWLAWLATAEWEKLKRRATLLLKRLRNAQLYSCLRGFRTNVALQKKSRRHEELVTTMLKRMLNKQLFQTFCVWSAEAIVQRHERLALKMLRRVAGRVVYSAMQTWKLYLQCRQDKAHKQLKAKTMLARLEGNLTNSCFLTWIEWHREAVWLKFEEHAWQSERQLRAARRAEQRQLREQTKRSLREEIMDVNTSLTNLSSMLVDQFGVVVGPTRATRAQDKYAAPASSGPVEALPPFVPAGTGPSKARSRAAPEAAGPRSRRRAEQANTADPRAEAAAKEQRSPAVSPVKPTSQQLHALTGSPPKRGRGSPKPLAPIHSGKEAGDNKAGDGDDWWKTRPFSFTAS